MKDYKVIEEQREYERLSELDRLHYERHHIEDNRAARRRAAAIARLRAKALVKKMRAEGVDFIHDKR